MNLKMSILILKIIFNGGFVMNTDKNRKKGVNSLKQNISNKKGFALPITSSNPPMPPVHPPKKKEK